MDKIELRAVQWMEHMADALSGLLVACERLDIQDEAWRSCTREWGPDAYVLGKLYTAALRERHQAYAEQDFCKYCQATYALTQDWDEVRRSIPWLHWGGSSYLGKEVLQGTIVLVCGHGSLKEEKLLPVLDNLTRGEGAEVLQQAQLKGVLLKEGDVWKPGPNIPTCYRD
jgi:hypothetical protein